MIEAMIFFGLIIFGMIAIAQSLAPTQQPPIVIYTEPSSSRGGPGCLLFIALSIALLIVLFVSL